MESLETWTLPRSLEDRVLTTLRIADRWGYGLAGEDVARLLYGGSANAADVTSALVSSPAIAFRDGVATLPGRDDLVEKVIARRRSNGTLAALYFGIAEEFSRDLLRHSPFIRAIAAAIHRLVRLSRERDPEAIARLAFLRRAKFPYDVFQD